MKLVFNHSGAMGDIFYSLYFVTQFLQSLNVNPCQTQFNIPLQVPFRQSSYPSGVNIPMATGKFISVLLEQLGFTVTHKKKSQLPAGYIDLDLFRNPAINHLGGDNREWYYQCSPKHLPKDFYRKIFNISAQPISQLQTKIIVLKTSRYINPFIDWKKLEQFQSSLIFMGLQHQYNAFCKQIFTIPYIKVQDGLDAAIKMKSALGVLGNPSGLFALAQCLKVPRIFVSSQWKASRVPGPIVVLPLGGWNQVIRVNQKLVPAVKQLLNTENANV